MVIELYSYGTKHNHEELDVDEVFTCHLIRNPYLHPELKHISGLNEEVQVFVWADRIAKTFYNQAIEAVHNGATALAYECYGGKHRSVAMVEIVAEGLRDLGYRVNINHLSLGVGYEAR